MSAPEIAKFRLYVAGNAPNSMQAVSNLNALCRSYLPGRHVIEIVNVLREPKRALRDRVFMTPMLEQLFPLPRRRIVGTLKHTAQVVQALGLEPLAA